ncbi:thioredoxin domain [Tokyovirus A1]|uniref:thioredoxin domain n=1 Tax=Tokyovirus A1 TaxID=1826170 RepID=UPI0007A9747B|nr:thioredoxin domain [Tokyovirus A1]BAU80141.1 thioredoxin [Tokyovirus A1]
MRQAPQQQQTQKRVPQELTDGNFARAIRSNTFYVVDAWASWCGPCRAMLPKFDELTAACARKDVSFAKVHVADPASARVKDALKISSLPTFIIFKNGVEVARKSGGDEVKSMAAWIDQFIGKPQ